MSKLEDAEITEGQLVLMTGICYDPDLTVFSQTSPKPDDPPLEAAIIGQAERDVDHLTALGFLKNITADHKERIDILEKSTGRKWRVFEILPLGRMFFQAHCSPKVN